MNTVNSKSSANNVYMKRDTLQILDDTKDVCRKNIHIIKDELNFALQYKDKQKVSALRSKLDVLKNDNAIRENITQKIMKTGEFSTPFYHFYKDNPQCHHKSKATLKDPESLFCLEMNTPKAAREEYHAALKKVPLENESLQAAFKPSFSSRLKEKIRNINSSYP